VAGRSKDGSAHALQQGAPSDLGRSAGGCFLDFLSVDHQHLKAFELLRALLYTDMPVHNFDYSKQSIRESCFKQIQLLVIQTQLA
jgi:hypothetical protein